MEMSSKNQCLFVMRKGAAVQTVICKGLLDPEEMVKCEISPVDALRRFVLSASRVTVSRGTSRDDHVSVITTAVDGTGTQTGSGAGTVYAGTQARSIDVCRITRDTDRVKTFRAFPVANMPFKSRKIPPASPARLASMRSQAVRPRLLRQVPSKCTDWIAPAERMKSAEHEVRATNSSQIGNSLIETLKFWEQRFMLFSKFEYGIMLDEESFQNTCPEIVASHIARQCDNYEKVLVPSCGAGSCAIQLAMIGHKVIAIDKDPLKILQAKRTEEVYGVIKRIDFRVGDCFEYASDIKADVIVTSLARGMEDEMVDILRLSRKITPRVILNMSKDINFDRCMELARNEGFGRINVEKVLIDGSLNSFNFYFIQDVRNSREMVFSPTVSKCMADLKTQPMTKRRESEYLETNNITCYNNYLKIVDEYLEENSCSQVI